MLTAIIGILIAILILIILPIFVTQKLFYNLNGNYYESKIMLYGIIPIWKSGGTFRIEWEDPQGKIQNWQLARYFMVNSFPYFFLVKHIQVASYNLSTTIGQVGTLFQHFIYNIFNFYGYSRYNRAIAKSYIYFQERDDLLQYYTQYTIIFSLFSLIMLFYYFLRGKLYEFKIQKRKRI